MRSRYSSDTSLSVIRRASNTAGRNTNEEDQSEEQNLLQQLCLICLWSQKYLD